MKQFNLPKLDTNSQLHFLTIEQVKNALISSDFDMLNQIYYLFINRDLKISESLEKRKDKILSLDFEIKNIHPILKDINIPTLIKSLLDSIYYGWSIVDVKWEIKNNLLLPTQFKKIHPLSLRKIDNSVEEYFYLLEKNTQKEIKLDTLKEQLIFHNHTKSDHIQTESLAYKIAFYAILKHTAIVYNMQYFDSLAIPPIIVKSDNLTDEDNLQELISEISRLKSNSFAIFGNDISIDTLTKPNSQTDFLSLIKYFDNLISHFLTGLGEAGEGSKSGSYALSKTTQNRLEEKVQSDCAIIADTITTFLNKILNYNLTNFQPVEFKFIFTTDEQTIKENNSKETNNKKQKYLSYQDEQIKLIDKNKLKKEIEIVYDILKKCSNYEEALSEIEKFNNPLLETALENIIFANGVLGEFEK